MTVASFGDQAAQYPGSFATLMHRTGLLSLYADTAAQGLGTLAAPLTGTWKVTHFDAGSEVRMVSPGQDTVAAMLRGFWSADLHATRSDNSEAAQDQGRAEAWRIQTLKGLQVTDAASCLAAQDQGGAAAGRTQTLKGLHLTEAESCLAAQDRGGAAAERIQTLKGLQLTDIESCLAAQDQGAAAAELTQTLELLQQTEAGSCLVAADPGTAHSGVREAESRASEVRGPLHHAAQLQGTAVASLRCCWPGLHSTVTAKQLIHVLQMLEWDERERHRLVGH